MQPRRPVQCPLLLGFVVFVNLLGREVQVLYLDLLVLLRLRLSLEPRLPGGDDSSHAADRAAVVSVLREDGGPRFCASVTGLARRILDLVLPRRLLEEQGLRICVQSRRIIEHDRTLRVLRLDLGFVVRSNVIQVVQGLHFSAWQLPPLRPQVLQLVVNHLVSRRV